MRLELFARVASSAVIVAMLAGCGASAGSGGTPATVAFADRRAGHSWMAPDTSAQNLLYVTGPCGGICIFSYPGGTLVGEITDSNSPERECVDKSGDVFVVDYGGENGTPGVDEYVHGGTTPIAELNDPGYYPGSCSIDPTAGNLAVSESGASGATSVVAIYTDATGDPTNYVDPKIFYMGSCGYDDKGNLFVDGQYDHKGTFELDEMPAGSTDFTRLKLAQAPSDPFDLQWAGKYVALSAGNGVIDHVKVVGSKGTLVGTTLLNGKSVGSYAQFWIQGATIATSYATTSDTYAVGLWNYPAGGLARKSIGASEFKDYEPVGVVVSLATAPR
ncbi:MAG TPA: hypothetical protein VGI19_01455 [Candidatus Cybelea sp.]